MEHVDIMGKMLEQASRDHELRVSSILSRADLIAGIHNTIDCLVANGAISLRIDGVTTAGYPRHEKPAGDIILTASADHQDVESTTAALLTLGFDVWPPHAGRFMAFHSSGFGLSIGFENSQDVASCADLAESA